MVYQLLSTVTWGFNRGLTAVPCNALPYLDKNATIHSDCTNRISHPQWLNQRDIHCDDLPPCNRTQCDKRARHSRIDRAIRAAIRRRDSIASALRDQS